MDYKYDIAISFNSEILEHAVKISSFLEAEGLKVFFDRNCQIEMYSEKLYEKLYSVYKNESFLRVILFSPKYQEDEITKIEQRIILRSAKKDKRFLIVNFDSNIKKDEKYKEHVYVDGTEMQDEEIAIEISDYLKKILSEKKDTARHSKKDETQNITISNHGVITRDGAWINTINL